MSKKKQFRVVCAYDTETTTLKNGSESRAFACLYIFNDLRKVSDFRAYVPEKSDDIHFYRTGAEAISYIQDLITYGRDEGFIPIIAAYNLAFDLQTLLWDLAHLDYNVQVNAQSGSNIYTYDLCVEDNIVLRFWDTFFLDMNGLASMGRTAGLPKAVGDWDYSLIRTPETPLTDKELYYAGRDTQVIPAYLKYLLEANEWMSSSDLGVRVLTKTSIVRQMAKHVIANKKIIKRDGKKLSLGKAFDALCAAEFAPDYESYALRKACFRGGFTFTAANTAAIIQKRVVSLDVTSMHHTFITGSRCPVHFHKAEIESLDRAAYTIMTTPLGYVLQNYSKPFELGLHALIEFRNIRLRPGTVFDRAGIALLAEGKFVDKGGSEGWDNERAYVAQDSVTTRGWHDIAEGATFAFGKLYKAKRVRVFVTEIELWCIGQMYTFDEFGCLKGELTTHTITPPDYVTLQTNILFEMKNDAKKINNTYEEGHPYIKKIPDSIPEGIAAKLHDGSMTNQAFAAWYGGNVKGMFNSIYGTQAQDLLKPEYAVDGDGGLFVDKDTLVTPENYEDKAPDTIKVFYNYGMRIVGRSRMHLVIAMMLIDAAFGDRVRILGGDTDSMKISLDDSITADNLIEALKPLHTATTTAIDRTQTRVRALFPRLASQLEGVGTFDIEPATHEKIYYDLHYEAWNKARLSLVDNHSHITCAGLSRPAGKYTVEDLVDDLIASGHTFEEIAPLVLGYNTTYDNSVCHALNRTHPDANEIFDDDVTDYLGNTTHVHAAAAIALYETDRMVGDTLKLTNSCNVDYLKQHGRNPYITPHRVCYNGKPYIEIGQPLITSIVE